MLHTTVQVDLVWLTQLQQDLFRLVSLLGGKDLVHLCCTDGKRALDVLQLFLVYERGVRGVSHIDLALFGTEVADHVLSTKAVSDCADFLFRTSVAARPWACAHLPYLASVLGPHLDEARVDYRVDHWRQMSNLALAVVALHPFPNVEVSRTVEGDRVGVEQIRHEYEVAIGRKLVGDELGIVEAMANHVGYTTVSPTSAGVSVVDV